LRSPVRRAFPALPGVRFRHDGIGDADHQLFPPSAPALCPGIYPCGGYHPLAPCPYDGTGHFRDRRTHLCPAGAMTPPQNRERQMVSIRPSWPWAAQIVFLFSTACAAEQDSRRVSFLAFGDSGYIPAYDVFDPDEEPFRTPKDFLRDQIA